MRIFSYAFLVLSMFALGACAHPMSHELFPWQLSCGDTPDGFVGVIWNDEGDLYLPLGGDDNEIHYLGICNRTHHPLTMANVGLSEVPVSGAILTGTRPPIEDLRGFLSGDDLLFDPVTFFDRSWVHFFRDPLEMDDELRRYTFVGHASNDEGEFDFRIGNDDGTFAALDTFMTDEGPVPLDHIYHNVAISRRVIVGP
jgi:hypothetical protein